MDLCNRDISVEDVKRLFNIKSRSEFEELRVYVDKLFEEKVINWKLVGESIFKRNSQKLCLEPNEVIKEMIGLVQ